LWANARFSNAIPLFGSIAMLVPLSRSPAAEELLVIPYSCKVLGGHVELLPSADRSYRIYGTHERQHFFACSPINPGRCRSWMLHRFDLDCGGARASWQALVAAVSDRRTNGLAWVGNGQMHVRMAPWWAGTPNLPCPARRWWNGGFQPRYLRPLNDWRCAQSVIDFPPGFAPVMGTGAKFIAASPAPTAAKKPPAPLHPTIVSSPCCHPEPTEGAGAPGDDDRGD
jgi:hypothetical protein